MNIDRKWNWIVHVYLLLTLVAVFISSWFIPQNGWDLLGHLGSAISIGVSDPVEIHRITYDIAQQTLKPEIYDELVNASDVRRAWADDAISFNQLLPFYQPRVLLTHLTYFTYKLGINPILAMRMISTIAATVGLCFFFLLLKPRLHRNAVVFLPLIVLLGGVLEVARFEGADALSFCFFGMAVYFIARKHWLGLLIIMLLPITRSDMIVMVFLLAPYCLIVYKTNRLAVIFCTAVAFGLYLLCNGIYGNYGWEKQFYVAHIKYLAFPADVETLVTPKLYIQGFFRGSQKLVYNKMFHFFLLGLGVVAIYLYSKIRQEGIVAALNKNIFGWIAFISGIFVFAHYIIFPSMNIRYFAGQYTLIAMCALCILQYGVVTTDDRLDE